MCIENNLVLIVSDVNGNILEIFEYPAVAKGIDDSRIEVIDNKGDIHSFIGRRVIVHTQRAQTTKP